MKGEYDSKLDKDSITIQHRSYILSLTVSAPLKPQGSIFQNEFLDGVILIFYLPGVVIEMGFYK